MGRGRQGTEKDRPQLVETLLGLFSNFPQVFQFKFYNNLSRQTPGFLLMILLNIGFIIFLSQGCWRNHIEIQEQ